MTREEQTWVRCAKMYGIELTLPFNPHRIKTFRKRSAQFRVHMQRMVKKYMREAQSQHSRGIVSESGSRIVKQIINEDRIWARENHQPRPIY